MISNSRDEGSASILTLAIASIVVFLFSAIGVGFAIAHEFRVTQNAADLSALAGAATIVSDSSSSCKTAQEIAVRNQSRMIACTVGLDVIQIRTQSLRFGWVHATAKAGI